MGLGLLLKRFERCRAVYERNRAPATPPTHGRGLASRGQRRLQAGFCDALVCMPDASCGVPCDVDIGSAACDVLSSCGCPCPSPCDLWPPPKKNSAYRPDRFRRALVHCDAHQI